VTRRLVAHLAATLLLAATVVAAAQPGQLGLRGEVGVDSGPVATWAGGTRDAHVPLTIRARLEAELPLTDAVRMEGVASPAIAVGTDADDPRLVAGLQEARIVRRGTSVDLSAGLERWPLGELRLAPALRLDGALPTGEPRGLVGARATAYLHPWRLRVGVAAPTGDDLVPDRLGAAASLRLDVAQVTLEGHAFRTARSGGGATASATVGDLVVYGEAWLLHGPWEARGGAGLTGYLGDLLWTAEAAWAPPDGGLEADARPALRVAGNRAIGRSGSLDAGAGLAFPASRADPERRVAQVDAYLAWSVDRPEATLTVRPSVVHGDGVTRVGARLSLTSYF
jgi:hypothetical protein